MAKRPTTSASVTPVSFLTAPPGSGFSFHVVCDLRRLAPEFADNDRWKTLIQAAFKHAFTWLGFGAKTAVGYRAMHPDEAAMQRLREQEALLREQMAKDAWRNEEDARLAELPAIEREMAEAIRVNQDPNVKDYLILLNALKQCRWQEDDSRVVAERIKQMMTDAKVWKEKTEKKDPAKDRDYQRTLEVLKYLR